MTMPGLPMLQGWWDQIAQPVQQLGQTIPKLINPDIDIQNAFKQFIAANPDKATGYADLAAQNPELFKSLKLGKMGDQVAKGPTSTKLQKDNMLRDTLKNNPKAGAQMLSREQGILTEEENEAQQLDLANKKLSQDMTNLQLKIANTKIKDDEKEKLSTDTVNNFLKALPTNLPKNLYALSKSGQMNQDLLTLIQESPALSKRMQEDSQNYFQEDQAKRDRERLSLQKKGMADDNWLLKSRQNLAERMAVETGTGDPGAFFELLKPGQMAAMNELDKAMKKSHNSIYGGGKIPDLTIDQLRASSPQVATMYEAFKGIQAKNEARVAGDKLKADKEKRQWLGLYNSAFSKLNGARSSFLNDKGDINTLNAAMEDFNLTADNMRAQGYIVPTAGLNKKNQLVFTTDDGDEVPFEAGASLRPKQLGEPMSEDDKIKSGVDLLLKDANAESELAKLKVINPARYEKVAALYYAKKGVPKQGGK